MPIIRGDHRCANRAPVYQSGEKGSRFWNVSGVKADVGLSGAKVQLENLSALVNGAIAFDSPPIRMSPRKTMNITCMKIWRIASAAWW